MVSHNHLELKYRGIWCPLQASEGTRHAMVHIHTCRENTHKVNLLKNINLSPIFRDINKFIHAQEFSVATIHSS